MKRSDFFVYSDGGPMSTVYLLMPLTEAAKAWAKEHLPAERVTFGTSIAVEHRYIGDIVEGIIRDGLTVS